MRQLVTPGFVPATRRWFWVVACRRHPTKMLFSTCGDASRYAVSWAERNGAEVVVIRLCGEVRRKTFEGGGDSGLRVVGCDLL